MAVPKFSEDVHPITELKTKTATLIEHVNRSRRPVLLTRRGRGVAVLLDLDEYESLVDRAGFIDAVNVGAAAAAGGDLHPHEEAERILLGFDKADG